VRRSNDAKRDRRSFRKSAVPFADRGRAFVPVADESRQQGKQESEGANIDTIYA